jgi:type IV secretory pathway TrbF-like protein
MPSAYAAALAAWRRHVVDARRQATAWRFAAAASVTLCAGLAGSLALALTRPVVALHVVQGTMPSRISAGGAPIQPATPIAIPSVLQGPHVAGSSSGPSHTRAEMGGIAAKK